VIELFTVPPDEDDAFLAAWHSQPRDAALLRALRDDVQPRFASLTDAPEGGVLLIGRFDVPETRPQGFLGARDDDGVTIVHWSSPLMYARTGWTLNGELYSEIRPEASSRPQPGS
jgi:hypothetical protein